MAPRRFSFTALLIAASVNVPLAVAQQAPSVEPAPLDILWRVKIGSASGSLAVHGDALLVGTNVAKGGAGRQVTDGVLAVDVGDALGRRDHAVLAGIDIQDPHRPRLNWWIAHPRLGGGRPHDLPYYPLSSTPAIDGHHAYYISNRGELVSVRLAPGAGDFPHPATLDPPRYRAEIAWELDMVEELGVHVRFQSDVGGITPSPIVIGDLVFCVTGNSSNPGGPDRGVPAPDAPSFIAVDKQTGELVWSSTGPGEQILAYQQATPAAVEIARDGEAVQLVVFPAGDGHLYAFEAATGQRVWKTDVNPPDAPPEDRRWGGGTPLVHEGVIYTGINASMEGAGWGRTPLVAIEAETGAVLWRFEDEAFNGVLGPMAVHADSLYMVSRPNLLLALDRTTGEEVWRHELHDDVSAFGTPVVHDGRLYVASVSELHVFDINGPPRPVHARGFDEISYHAAPVIHDGRVYVAVGHWLYCLRLP